MALTITSAAQAGREAEDKVAALEPGSPFHQQQIQAELFKLRVRRDAKRMLDAEESAAAAGNQPTTPLFIYDPLPTETPELITGLLPENGAAAIVSETNQGKSLLLCEIGSSLLTGTPLWGHIKPNRVLGRVVYVLGEHTAATIQGLFHHTGLPHDGDFRLIGPELLHPHKSLVVNGQQQLTAIDMMLRHTEGAGLIIFDPLSGFVQGSGAENDNSSMRTLIDVMSYVAERQKAACLIAAHQGKPKIDESGQEVRRTVYATRGASAVEDSLTTIFYLRKSTLVKQQGHQGERFELLARKRKGVTVTDVFKLQRDPETLRHTLLNPSAKLVVPTIEEKFALASKVQRLLESNPKFDVDTAIQLVADAEGMPKATVEKWLTSVTG